MAIVQRRVAAGRTDDIDRFIDGTRQSGERAAALDILRSVRDIDLTITDIGMPGMTGRQLADLARQLRPRLNVLFVTGYRGTGMSADLDQPDGLAVLAKPVAIDALAGHIP